MIDARVGQGAAGKGRSGAKAVNRELRLGVPDLLGGDVQMNSMWGESAVQSMDEPSRGRPVLPPATPTAAEQRILDGQEPLVSDAELRRWRRGLWVAPLPTPLRRFRWGYRGVRVGQTKKPGPARIDVAPLARQRRRGRSQTPPPRGAQRLRGRSAPPGFGASRSWRRCRGRHGVAVSTGTDAAG